MMMEGLLFVAIWCGNPGGKYTTVEIDNCRKKLVECLINRGESRDTLNTISPRFFQECSMQTKLSEFQK